MHSRGTTTRGLTAALGRVRLAGVIAVVLAVAGLSGCTGDDPAPTPPATSAPAEQTPSPTPTPTPTPTDPAAVPPERPEAMDTVDTAGAEAFATYFIQLFPYVNASGDLAAFESYSHAECIFCANAITQARAQTEAGGHREGGFIEVRSVTALEVDPGVWWAVSMDILEAPLEDIDTTGAVVSQANQTAYHLEMSVVRANGMWQMREISHEVTP